MVDIYGATAYLKRIDMLQGDNGGTGIPADLCARIFSHEAAVFYLIDAGDSYGMVTQPMLEDAGISENELHQIGLANLARRFESMQLAQAGDIFFFTGSGDFEASLVLLDPLWEQLAPQFPNGPAAVLPARDTLAVCDSGNAAAIGKIRSMAEAVLANPQTHPIGTEVYVRSDDGWSVPGLVAPVGQPVDEADDFIENFFAEGGDSEVIEIANQQLFGNEMPTSEQFGMLAASGYNWYPDTQTFRKTAPGKPGSPERPWLEPEWSPKRGGFFKKLAKR